MWNFLKRNTLVTPIIANFKLFVKTFMVFATFNYFFHLFCVSLSHYHLASSCPDEIDKPICYHSAMNNKHVPQLIKAATSLVNKYADDKNHTVAAAVLAESGKVITSLNFYHFTGGPDAEIAALAQVVSEGEIPIMLVVVGHNNRGVLTPCGKCRQTIFDYYPKMQVIVSNEGAIKTISELLPNVYSWNDQQ